MTFVDLCKTKTATTTRRPANQSVRQNCARLEEEKFATSCPTRNSQPVYGQQTLHADPTLERCRSGVTKVHNGIRRGLCRQGTCSQSYVVFMRMAAIQTNVRSWVPLKTGLPTPCLEPTPGSPRQRRKRTPSLCSQAAAPSRQDRCRPFVPLSSPGACRPR